MKPSRLNYLLLFSLIMTIFSCNKEKDNEQPTVNGLVSFYNFQGNSNDVFGDNNGTGFNVEYIAEENHADNKVLSLNGVNSYVNLLDSFDYQDRTINLWLNVNAVTPELGIIYVSDNPGLNYGLTILCAQLIDSHPVLIYNISGQLDTIDIELNTWYNATLEIEGMKYEYYLDNNKFKSGNINSYISSYNGVNAAIIGCNRTLSERFFNGMVDDLRIYKRKLSANEISVIYKAKH